MSVLKNCVLGIFLFLGTSKSVFSQREHLLMDFGWRFAFGHPFDPQKDFNNGTSYFSYFAKAGFGDGAAAPGFDDGSWRELDLPHDWAVEQPLDKSASYSHGFRAIGRKFPNASVGWYRRTFSVSPADLGKRIHLTFDGVFRNSIVWINGHYLGTEASGYNGFTYDITDYLNYGGSNVVAVRVDATMEEGWFYEGAGIYRHVWLDKTNALHVARNGTFVSTRLKEDTAELVASVTLANDGDTTAVADILQEIEDREGAVIASRSTRQVRLRPFQSEDYACEMKVLHPRLWSVDTPYLHKLITTVMEDGRVVDRYETSFGMRSIRFDPNEGFFLNGKRLEIKGTNNHQDYAGVGTAMEDALQTFRIASLKALGANAYRCSHNPPTPELLDACDSLGMLVIDENRLMGTAATHLDNVRQLILRDRNHPSVISWSIGNEEWGIENTITGARIASTMQAYVKSIDSTRAVTAAFSGGGGESGISSVMELLGFNYIAQEDPDAQHKKFPWQAGWGTEEGSTFSTRGIYFDDSSRHMLAAYDKRPRPKANSIQEGWNYYVGRPFLAGMFIWTGFDYRGEPTPFGWPSNGSYFGMLDQCGFPKDDAWYLKAWWTKDTVLHILPHWNWKGREGSLIPVWAYSNCEEVELFLNGKTLGKQSMPRNGHLQWSVPFQAGTLSALGYSHGKIIAADSVSTTGNPVVVHMKANKELQANKEDIAVVTVDVKDNRGRRVPTADNNIHFTLTGPGKIIGVGNGDPTSQEPDKYLAQRDQVTRKMILPASGWQRKLFSGLACVIVQSTGEPGEIRLRASSEGLRGDTLLIRSAPAPLRAAVSEYIADSIKNPIVEGYFADPTIIKEGGSYYIYATVDPWGSNELGVFETTDFKTFTRHHLNWPTKEACTSPTSGDAMVWAPSIRKAPNGKFYLYVAVGSEIWVGVSDHPLGPWKNALGEHIPLVSRKDFPEVHDIDPDCFIDSDGQAYLYWGSGFNWVNGRCMAVKLQKDMVHFDGKPRDITPPHYFEAPHLVRRKGIYYLMYSYGKAIDASYQVRYSAGKTPFGPWTEGPNDPILSTSADSSTYGPGHHTVFTVGENYYILYHRIHPQKSAYVLRQLCIDSLNFDKSGNILKIDPKGVMSFTK